eukprot:g4246.t1
MAASSVEQRRQAAIVKQLNRLVVYSLRHGPSSVALDTDSNVTEAVSWARNYLDEASSESLDDSKAVATRNREDFVRKLRLHAQDAKAAIFNASWRDYTRFLAEEDEAAWRAANAMINAQQHTTKTSDHGNNKRLGVGAAEEGERYGILELLFALAHEPLTVPVAMVGALRKLREKKAQQRARDLQDLNPFASAAAHQHQVELDEAYGEWREDVSTASTEVEDACILDRILFDVTHSCGCVYGEQSELLLLQQLEALASVDEIFLPLWRGLVGHAESDLAKWNKYGAADACMKAPSVGTNCSDRRGWKAGKVCVLPAQIFGRDAQTAGDIVKLRLQLDPACEKTPFAAERHRVLSAARYLALQQSRRLLGALMHETRGARTNHEPTPELAELPVFRWRHQHHSQTAIPGFFAPIQMLTYSRCFHFLREVKSARRNLLRMSTTFFSHVRATVMDEQLLLHDAQLLRGEMLHFVDGLEASLCMRVAESIADFEEAVAAEVGGGLARCGEGLGEEQHAAPTTHLHGLRALQQLHSDFLENLANKMLLKDGSLLTDLRSLLRLATAFTKSFANCCPDEHPAWWVGQQIKLSEYRKDFRATLLFVLKLLKFSVSRMSRDTEIIHLFHRLNGNGFYV